MIDLDPSSRPSFDTLLHTSRGTVFPETFYSFLHNYVSSINDLPHNPPFATSSPPSAPSAPSIVSPSIVAPSLSGATIRSTTSVGHHPSGVPSPEVSDALPSDSDHRMERIWADYESVESYLTPEGLEDTMMDIRVEYTRATGSSKPFQVCFGEISSFVR